MSRVFLLPSGLTWDARHETRKKELKMATKKVAKKSSEKLFEGYERREAKILAALKPYGITLHPSRALQASREPYALSVP